MPRTLVIPDIHNRIVSAQRLIDTIPHDKCILLGDYFDNFGDTYQDAHNTAVWLREFVLPNPKIIPLLGNHDTQYFWPWHHYFRCSGFSDMKSAAIVKELNARNTNDFEKFQFYHIDQGYFFTHAGLDNRTWKDMKRGFEEKGDKTKLEFVDEVLTYWVAKARKDIGLNQRVELLGAGWDRGGNQIIGGINWIDFSNLSPINGVSQIVGHTPHPVPDVKIQKQGGSIAVKDIFEFYDHKHFPSCKNPLSINYAIDTHSKHYAIVEDEEIQIWDVQHNLKVQDFAKFAIPGSPLSGLPGLLPPGAFE